MTWLADVQQNRPDDVEREKLLASRAKLIKQVETLGLLPLPNNTQSAKIGRAEDLTKLAKKIKAIDVKLGRL